MRVWGGSLLLALSLGCASTVGGAGSAVDGSAPASDASSLPPGAAGQLIVAPEIARTCLLAVGCAAAPVGNLGACVTSLTRRALAPNGTGEDLWDRLLECSTHAATAATCDAFADCATLGHRATYCAAHPGESCDGNVAVHCGPDGAPATVEDCATIPGARCEP
jgi:hypothetical protein